MNFQKDVFKGTYVFFDGKFCPRGEMEKIQAMLRNMKMLAGSTTTSAGEFFFDPQDGSYWHYIQQENYDTELKRVDRNYIETNFPTVDCDRLYDVDW